MIGETTTQPARIRLTKDFYLDEFQCKCGVCKIKWPERILVDKLQLLRDAIYHPIFINSGIRCDEHNAALGGQLRSQHLYGRAVDIKCELSRIKYKILKHAFKIGFSGIGIYQSFIHLDVRPVDCLVWTSKGSDSDNK